MRVKVPIVAVNNLRLHAFSDADQLIALSKDLSGLLIAVNAEKIMNAHPVIVKALEKHIGYADGIGAVLAVRKLGIKTQRIPGAELWLKLAQAYPTETFFLAGSSSEVIAKVVTRFQSDFPLAKIVGERNGFLKSLDEETLFIAEVVKAQPRFLFLAMGSPRQELLMQKMTDLCPNTLFVGLGGSFDIYAGSKTRAPRIFRENGLEWAYRLLKEPTRIGRQMKLLTFIGSLAINRLPVRYLNQ